MRIRLEASDRLPFWIIGDPARPEREVTDGIASDSQVLDHSLQITRNQQPITGAEWDVKSFYDRGNQSVTFEGTGHRLFATESERQAFIETLAPIDPEDELHRWEGDVWLRTTMAAGAYRESLLPDAVVSLSGTRLEGAVGLYLTYRIQAGGFEIGSEREGVEAIMLKADGIDVGPPIIDFFGTEVGGEATDPADPGSIWDTGQESTAIWLLRITTRIITGGVSSVYTRQLSFGGTESGYTNIAAVPMKDRLADIAAEIDPDYITTEILTVSGRQCLRLTMAAQSEPIATDGSGHTPYLTVFVAARFGGSYTGTIIEVTEMEGRPTVSDLTLTDANGVSLIADRLT